MNFAAKLHHHALQLERPSVGTLQLNLGKRCNQACNHCHVDASPVRTEQMTDEVLDRVLELLAQDQTIHTVDITGGAPELHPRFREIVARAGRQVIDRCNLTILSEPGQEGLAAFLAEHRVQVIASLPCYTADNVDKQRGPNVFERSIAGIRELNALGYGLPGTGLELHLVYNPGGAFLPPNQANLEARYKDELFQNYGLRFNNLLTLANLPVKRFRSWLSRRDKLEAYQDLLESSFNPATVEHLMCRSTLSVSWDGRVYDCDFHQMEGIPANARSVLELGALQDAVGPIALAEHCFGCTAGAGSSCGGALA